MDRNLLLRVASAAVALPILGALVLWREPLGFGILSLAVAALAMTEYAKLTLRDRPRAERSALAAVGVGFGVAVYARPELAATWAMLAVVLVGAGSVARPGDMATAGARLGVATFGVFYVGGLVVALPLLHREGSLWLIVALAVTFVADTGAYFVGRHLGRHKLAPLISPGKTWEGVAGGLGCGLGFMFAARETFFPGLTATDCLLIGLASGVLGPLGDLLESLIKRSAGVKDSGRLIPGHGGVLDRIDALLFVGAYVYLHVKLLR